jgi:hypothetical protein
MFPQDREASPVHATLTSLKPSHNATSTTMLPATVTKHPAARIRDMPFPLVAAALCRAAARRV